MSGLGCFLTGLTELTGLTGLTGVRGGRGLWGGGAGEVEAGFFGAPHDVGGEDIGEDEEGAGFGGELGEAAEYHEQAGIEDAGALEEPGEGYDRGDAEAEDHHGAGA